ncbi:uncharacterized protein LOC115742157 [Rhodamnia argentea]|uniref:Uncharacterized protein LOC115742157 n=1 Tax=Rhodamnia argentea TaxID=178133 RepID=A0A8B8PC02_9MYRT|nr:uncharacterized protein LOC115742157 [Rhodamnia argentea]
MERLCHDDDDDDNDIAEEEDEDEDEALSLSDLPLPLAGEDARDGGESRTEEGRRDDRDRAGPGGTEDPEFDFGSRVGGPLSSGWRMCAADELFFQGQILPLRLSVGSDSLRADARRSVSRSDSMEMGSISTRVSSMGSSRSNSHGSSRYSSSSSSRSSSMTNSSRASFSRVNPFHALPSPKPQIGPSPGKFRTLSQKSPPPPSSMWEFFRLGLIRTPDIGLAELKLRKSAVNGSADNQCLMSRNSSSSSSDSSINNGGLGSGANIKIKNAEEKTDDKKKKKTKTKQKSKNRERILNGSFLGGCRCSVDAVSSSVFAVKSGGQARASNVEDDGELVGEIGLMTKKVTEAKRKASRHRTFEWIKELSSHATYPVDS